MLNGSRTVAPQKYCQKWRFLEIFLCFSVPHLISEKTRVEGLHAVLCPVKILSKKWKFLETISLFIRNLFLEKTDVEGLHSCSG